MELKIQRDVLNDFYSGYIKEAYKTKNGISILIDMSEFKQYYHSSIFKCEFIGCRNIRLTYKDKDFRLDDFKNHNIEIRETKIHW